MRLGVKEIDYIGKLQEAQDTLNNSANEEVPEVTLVSVIINEALNYVIIESIYLKLVTMST